MPDAPDLHGLLTRCARAVGDLLLSDIWCLATFDFSQDEPLPRSIEEDPLGTRDRLALARDLQAAGYPVTPADAPAYLALCLGVNRWEFGLALLNETLHALFEVGTTK